MATIKTSKGARRLSAPKKNSKNQNKNYIQRQGM